jgi:hypothetical protein
VNDAHRTVRLAIAQNPNLHPDLQAKLVNDPDEYVREAIASNPNLHPDHHATLVNDPNEYVREAIAQNPSYIASQKLNKSSKLRFPVGTIRNRKKKVIVNGKAVWRSIISGQVRDSQGNAISIKSHNKQAEGD